MEKLHLSNLGALEAESIHIIREVAAEFADGSVASYGKHLFNLLCGAMPGLAPHLVNSLRLYQWKALCHSNIHLQ